MNNKELTGVASLKAEDGMRYSFGWSWNPPEQVKIRELRRLIEVDIGHIEVNVEINGQIAKEIQDLIEKNVK